MDSSLITSHETPSPRAHVIALDLGGTNLRAASVNRDGDIIARTKVRTPQTDDAMDVAAAMEEAFDVCATESNKLNAEVEAFAVAVPGALDTKRGGMVLTSPNIKQLDNFRLGDELHKRTGVQVFLENDANAAAVGEFWQGAGRDVKTLICLTLGTGVGGGLVLNGELWRGAFEAGGELGHINVEPEGYPCKCGSRGCLEQYASATAIARIYKEQSNNVNGEINAYKVYELARDNDANAIKTFEIVGRYLGSGIASLVNIIDPQLVVIGGGASAGWEMFIHHARAEIKARAFTERGRNIKIKQAACGDDAGILGAACIAWQKIKL